MHIMSLFKESDSLIGVSKMYCIPLSLRQQATFDCFFYSDMLLFFIPYFAVDPLPTELL
uniref:Uncharacterized protein n=1 Tax=Arundo donax TaxID=35708 RepID=A0A0A8ZJ00_ARUDO